jgi:hypothetical protein
LTVFSIHSKFEKKKVNLIVAIFKQAIEAMDRSRICTEYWDSRPYSRPPVQIPQTSQHKDSGRNSHLMSEERNDQGTPGNHLGPVLVDSTLRGLFKKANQEELNTLYSILSYNRPTADQGLVSQLLRPTVDQGLVSQLLSEEINNRAR